MYICFPGRKQHVRPVNSNNAFSADFNVTRLSFKLTFTEAITFKTRVIS